MHCLGKALARGSMKIVASSAFNCKGLRPHIEDLVASEISKECKNICSLKNAPSLRCLTKPAIDEFSWTGVGKEFKERTAFYRLLQAGAGVGKKYEFYPTVANAESIILNTRNKAMSLVQHINSLLLKIGKASKKVLVIFVHYSKYQVQYYYSIVIKFCPISIPIYTCILYCSIIVTAICIYRMTAN